MEKPNDFFPLQAWDLYYHVFRRIDKQLQTLTTLDLQARNDFLVFLVTHVPLP